MKNHIAFVSIIVIVLLSGCSKTEKKIESEVESSKEEIQLVQNILEFDIPLNNQNMMEISFTGVTNNNDGKFVIPSKSIQTVENQTVVFVKLSDLKFAMRAINAMETEDDVSIIHENIKTGETIVVNGADKVKTGVIRLILKDDDHGHSHGGPGGHTH